MIDTDRELLRMAMNLSRSEWKQIDSFIEKTNDSDIKIILESIQRTYRLSHELNT
jgi:hypothetical protein